MTERHNQSTANAEYLLKNAADRSSVDGAGTSSQQSSSTSSLMPEASNPKKQTGGFFRRIFEAFQEGDEDSQYMTHTDPAFSVEAASTPVTDPVSYGLMRYAEGSFQSVKSECDGLNELFTSIKNVKALIAEVLIYHFNCEGLLWNSTGDIHHYKPVKEDIDGYDWMFLQRDYAVDGSRIIVKFPFNVHTHAAQLIDAITQYRKNCVVLAEEDSQRLYTLYFNLLLRYRPKPILEKLGLDKQ